MLKKYISLIAIVISVCVTAYFIYLYKGLKSDPNGPYPVSWSITPPENSDTAFGGLFFDKTPNDSLPYYEYKKLNDSFEQRKNAIKNDNRSIFGDGRYTKHFGVIALTSFPIFYESKMFKQDSIQQVLIDSMDIIYQKQYPHKNSNNDSFNYYKLLNDDIMQKISLRTDSISKSEMESRKEKALYYLALNRYHIDFSNEDDHTQFFMRDGTYNLAYFKCDTVIKTKYDSVKEGHYESKQIPVRFSTEEGRILIPISKSRYVFLNKIMIVLPYLGIFLFVYFFIGLPAQVVYNISKGRAFSKNNISIFKLLSLVLLLYALLDTFTPYLLKFHYRKIIPREFVYESSFFHIKDIIPNYLWAIGLFIIAQAFNRGYKLQQEQDLTV